MNKLPKAKQVQCISALVEGNSVRSTERMTGVHRDTILRLMASVADVGTFAVDGLLRGLQCKRLQMDEIWCYVAKKQRHLHERDDLDRNGDMWTYCVIDAESKLVPSHLVGKRTAENTKLFVADVASRIEGRVQVSTDLLAQYVDAIDQGFGSNVDYGRIVKYYEADAIGPGRYSPPHVTAVERQPVRGAPDPCRISTSYIERQNLTLRMSSRRFTRLTNAFSKKLENLKAAVALHFLHYNFVRIHGSLRVTPAMAAGIVNELWTIEDFIDMAN